MTVMIVEDDAMLRSLISMKLRRRGWQAIEAGSGQEALELVVNSRPDWVITDISLPEMDGKELLLHLQKKYPGIKVIGITADSESLAELQSLSFYQVWEKPVTDEHLDTIAE